MAYLMGKINSNVEERRKQVRDTLVERGRAEEHGNGGETKKFKKKCRPSENVE